MPKIDGKKTLKVCPRLIELPFGFMYIFGFHVFNVLLFSGVISVRLRLGAARGERSI